MGIFFSLIAIATLILIGLLGPAAPGFFGIALPYIAIAVFIIGVIVRVLKWARAPVPFRITTTCGQQKSLDFIKQNKFDNPFTGFQTFIRMALEILTFRSLFRNTKAEFRDSSRLVYGENKWLWMFSIMFHWSFLVIFLRHFRFFTEPIPFFVPLLQTFDGFMEIGVPIIYMTNVAILAALAYLFFRRIFDQKVKYFSLASDYFPLLLISGIAVTGVLMRYFYKTDLVAIKQLTAGLLSFQPIIPDGIGSMFWVHFFLVCCLLIYFPMSKLVHLAGVFMSPTRNMANNNRAVRHENPWNPDVEFHTYEEYEDEFRDVMLDAGVPVEKEVGDVK